jgi:hypothetical protein
VKRIYIAGPMRGIPLHNFPAFDRARDFFRSAGFEVYSPADIDRAHGINELTWDDNAPDAQERLRELAKRDFEALIQCDAIALLPGWERSRGVKWEKPLAEFLKLEIYCAATGIRMNAPGRVLVNPGPHPTYLRQGETLSAPAPEPVYSALAGEQFREIRAAGVVVKDSGQRQEFASGMVRDTQENKVDYERIFDGPMADRWAAHVTAGALKYPDVAPGEPNWMKANGDEELIRFRKSATRHFRQWLRGDVDEDHAAAVLFNINGYEYVMERTMHRALEERHGIAASDDRPSA